MESSGSGLLRLNGYPKSYFSYYVRSRSSNQSVGRPVLVPSNNLSVFSGSMIRVTGRACVGQPRPWILTGVLWPRTVFWSGDGLEDHVGVCHGSRSRRAAYYHRRRWRQTPADCRAICMDILHFRARVLATHGKGSSWAPTVLRHTRFRPCTPTSATIRAVTPDAHRSRFPWQPVRTPWSGGRFSARAHLAGRRPVGLDAGLPSHGRSGP